MASEPDDRVSPVILVDDEATLDIPARIAELERRVEQLTGMVDDMSRVLQKFIVDQQMAAAMPMIEQGLRSQMQQKLATEGFKSVLVPPSDPAASGTPPS